MRASLREATSSPNLTRLVIAAAAALLLAAFAVVFSAGPAESAFPGSRGKIAYTCYPPSTQSAVICVIDPDGSNRGFMTNTTLRLGANYDVTPAWSADGGRLAFIRSSDDVVTPRDGPYGPVFVLRANRTGLKLISNPNFPDNDPAWFPDGRRLIFGSPLVVGMADGSGIQRLGGLGRDWAISPNGSRIAFTANEGIGVMNADTSGFRQLVSPGCCASRPDWSPDGTKLVFAMIRLGVDQSYDLWVKDVDSSSPPVRLFRTDNINEKAPVWAPDARSLVYSVSDRSDRASHIEVADADGNNRRAITSGPRDYFPDWQPCRPTCATVRSMREVGPLPTARVTLAVSRKSVTYPGAVTVSGRVSWDLGYSVDIRVRTCTQRSTRALTVETAEGGTFRERLPAAESATLAASFDISQGNPYGVDSPVISRSVKIQVRPRVRISRLASGRYLVTVVAAKSLAGRHVILELRRDRRWERLASGTLVRRGAGPFPNSVLSAATIRAAAPARASLRASLPASQAGPCYAASRSRVLRAG